MHYALIGVEAVIILLLLGALIVGQPASTTANLNRIDAQSTEVAMYRATLIARPPPTPARR